MLPAALIGIHFHFHMVLNVKNRAHAKCFEFAQEGLSPWVRQVESILVYYEKKTYCNKALCSRVLPLKKKRKKMIYCF